MLEAYKHTRIRRSPPHPKQTRKYPINTLLSTASSNLIPLYHPNMSFTSRIAIVGFTGKMARLITTSLLTRHPTVQIHGVSRSLDKVNAKYRSNPNVKLFQAASTDKSALQRALAGTSACICCYLGDKELMTDGQKLLIDACVAEGVPRYIASDYSLDFSKLAFGPYSRPIAYSLIETFLCVSFPLCVSWEALH